MMKDRINDNNGNKKIEMIFIVTMLLIGVVILVLMNINRNPGKQVHVSVSGERIASYPLDEDYEGTIEGKDGGMNRFVIQDGKVTVEEADCPDQICVNHVPVSERGEGIVCLPHEVVVEIQ